jgi:hypothetical protein
MRMNCIIYLLVVLLEFFFLGIFFIVDSDHRILQYYQQKSSVTYLTFIVHAEKLRSWINLDFSCRG